MWGFFVLFLQSSVRLKLPLNKIMLTKEVFEKNKTKQSSCTGNQNSSFPKMLGKFPFKIIQIYKKVAKIIQSLCIYFICLLYYSHLAQSYILVTIKVLILGQHY